tara:strand:- start:113 stop:589 length:477 start_codon:yes stop_codon:yes gene_type:complete
MAHFAELDSSNVVIQVIVISNEDVAANGGDYSSEAETFVSNLLPHSENGVAWKQTSYNGNQRKQFAGVGLTYDATKDKFILPKPFGNDLYESSWTLDSNDDWQAPVTYPNVNEVDSNPVSISWNEPNQEWTGKTYTGANLEIETDYVWNASSLEWREV